MALLNWRLDFAGQEALSLGRYKNLQNLALSIGLTMAASAQLAAAGSLR
jgi:hypothetical protein